MKIFITELKRRKVTQSVLAYAVLGWLLIQVGIALETALNLPSSTDRWIIIIVVAGFPLAIVLSWFYNFSSKGIIRTKDLPDESIEAQRVLPKIEYRTPAPKKSIAILPFKNLDEGNEQSFLGNGVAQEILNALVKVKPLKVAGRISSFSLEDRNLPISEIGKMLNVSYILEGTVRKQDNKARITAELTQVEDGFHVWTETFDGDLTDIFKLQDEIAKSILAELEIILDVKQLRLVATMTNSLEAYEAFIKGRKFVQIQDGDGVLAEAISQLGKAVRIDPEFALAWAWLAMANFYLPEHNKVPNWKEYLEAGKKAAKMSYKLDPELSDANLALSYERLLELDIEGQFEARKRAHLLDPSSIPAMHEYGMAYGLMGLIKEGYPYIRDSNEREPFSASFSGSTGIFQWMLGKDQMAYKSLDRTIDLGFVLCAISKSQMITSKGDPVSAHKYLLETLKKHKEDVPPEFKSRLVQKIFSLAINKNVGWAKKMIGKNLLKENNSLKKYSGLSLKSGILTLGEAKVYFDSVLEQPNTYLSGALFNLWTPTETAKSVRTHPEFPKFAQELGLVKLWQKHGWPPQIQPIPGSDGSNLQFICS